MRKLVLGFLLASAFLAANAHAQGYSPAAQRVLARARAAAGGSGWNLLRGWHETGREGSVAYEAWIDPVRYGLRVETHEAAGLRIHGFNGAGEWQIAPGGATTGADVTRMVSPARTEAFFRSYGYFFPGRFDARGEYLGVRRAQGRSFDVVAVKPWGAAPRDLWFDRKTRLLARMVDRSSGRPVVIQLSDYRKVGPIRVAFRTTVNGAEPAVVRERSVESLSFPPADRNLFSLPRTAEAAPSDAAAETGQ